LKGRPFAFEGGLSLHFLVDSTVRRDDLFIRTKRERSFGNGFIKSNAQGENGGQVRRERAKSDAEMKGGVEQNHLLRITQEVHL